MHYTATTLQLQLHYTTLQLQLQLHYNTLHPAVVGEVTTATIATIATISKNATPTTFPSTSGFALPSCLTHFLFAPIVLLSQLVAPQDSSIPPEKAPPVPMPLHRCRCKLQHSDRNETFVHSSFLPPKTKRIEKPTPLLCPVPHFCCFVFYAPLCCCWLLDSRKTSISKMTLVCLMCATLWLERSFIATTRLHLRPAPT